ncbi:MAG TPA: hypothetical protein DEQ34_13600 [Balneolaceae bacterium]|nr:hypothetical protein [Balneolaceae bacterium]
MLMMLSALLAVLAVGPGWYGGDFQGGFNFQHQLFDLLCHQNPDRSFQLQGVQMAVCSRCLGIYLSFFLGVLLMAPLSIFSKKFKTFVKPAFFTILILNFLDVISNEAGIWTNSLFSRFWLGALVGLGAALLLSNEFFSTNSKSENNYGE